MTARGKSTRRAADEIPKDAPVSEVARKIRALREALGSSAGKAEVYRKVVGKPPVYLAALGIDELVNEPHEVVRHRWGGGEYQITLRDASGDYMAGGSMQLTIGGPPAPEPDKFDEIQKRWDERLAAASKGDASSPELMRFMFDTMREQLREIRTPPAAAAGGNPIEMAVSMVTAIQAANAPILEALLKRSSAEPKERNRTEELRELLELVTLVQGLAGNNNGGGSGLDRVIDKLADPLASFFSRAAPTTSGPPGAPMLAPPPPAPSPSPNGRPAWYPLLERALPQLVAWARAQKDPELRADLVIDDLPDHLLGPVHEQLQRGDNFFTEFMEHVPAASEFRPWFGAFFTRLRFDLDTMYTEGDVEGASAAETPPASVDSGAPTT